MLPKILIIIGVLLIVGGVFGILTVCVQPIMKAFRIVYTQDWEDYWYEHGRGQDAQRAGRRLLITMYSIFIALGLCLVISGLTIQYMPHGNDSVLSSQVQGGTSGEENRFGDSYAGNGALVDYTIVISGEVIRLNGKTFESVEAFEEELKGMDRTKTVSIVDDFAVSSVYHQVWELVNRYGLECEENP